MKRYLFGLCIMLTGLLLTSCLSSDDEDTTSYDSDTVITAFTLTTVNRYIHTASSTGSDSVYKKSLSNPATFTIDQYQHKIYNTDSLPSDCDLSHVLATISTTTSSGKNGGVIALNYLSSTGADSLMSYSSTDSIDFTKIKEIRAYSIDGSGYRTYEVSINKHQVESGKLIWEKMSASDMPKDAKRAAWEQLVAASGLKLFIGAGRAEAYAFDNNGQLMVSKDEGATWSVDNIEDSSNLLPTENIAFVSWPFTANDSTDYQLMIGTTDEDATACVVWRKVAEFAVRSLPSKWVYIPASSTGRFYLPKMDNLSLVYYKGDALAIGNDGKIYVSRDQGITWRTTSAYTLPSEIGTYNVSAMTDGNGYIWLSGKDTGEVWRGLMIE